MDSSLQDPRSGSSGFKTGQRYPSPFFDIATLFLPPRLKDLFKFCQMFGFSDEIISATIYKLAQFPITDIIYDSNDDDHKDKWRKILEEDLGLRTRMEEAGLDYNLYGNYIASFYVPFSRMLACPSCHNEVSIKGAKFKWEIKDFGFYMKCKKCSPNMALRMRVKDKPLTKTTKGMNIVRWDPQNIDIEYNPISGNSTYYYNLPNAFKRQIWAGRRKVLEETPMSFIMASKEGARVELDSANLIHIKRPSFSYFDNGWGMPLVVPLLKSRYYYQTLLKAREALYVQHITPMWMLYPQPQANVDPHGHMAMAKWRQEIEGAIRKWRRDPNHIAIFPIPTGFQQIGGDAKALSVIDELKFIQETMIIGLQVPKEFLVGGMSWSGSSVTFRMVENFFLNHIRGLKHLMNFVVERVSKATKMKPIGLNMTRLKWVDDVQQKSLLMQANVNQKVSDDTFVSELGHDMSEEFKKMTDEVEKRGKIQAEQMKQQAEAEGEMMLTQIQYQIKAQVEQAKAQRDILSEYQAMGFTPEEIQGLMMSLNTPQGGGGQFTPGGPMKNEPNKPGTANQPGDMYANQFASTIQGMDPAARNMAMMNLQLKDPAMHQDISQRMTEANGVDARPNPDQKPPKRNAGKTPSPSKPSGK